VARTFVNNIHDALILIVDDDDFYRRMLKTALLGLGNSQNGEAHSGSSAIDYLMRHPCDLLIVDVHMPDINGIELLQKIRAGETASARNIPVIIFTSFSETAVLRTAMALDVNGFLVKPTTADILKKKLLSAFADTFHPKTEAEYHAVSTSLPGIPSGKETMPDLRSLDTTSHTIQSTTTAKELIPGCTRVSLLELDAGMTFGSGILAKDGSLLLSAGTVLTTNNIKRLLELEKILFDQKVWIVNETL
jgi:two-component system chemotaxis response regulator CheY